MSLFVLFAAAACGQDAATDPAYESLTKAFDALRVNRYDSAIEAFRHAILAAPRRADIRKNLAYALLRTGDTDSARDEFGEAMRLDPADFHVALEYAFLCFEARSEMTARKAEARRIFAAVRDRGDVESRATAANAFRNIDEPLRTGIERWKQALASSEPTFSAHYELAQLAEQRDETELAATNYKAAFRLLPARKSVLLDLARVSKAGGNSEGMMAALIAASRGGEPRAAELAKELLPDRYPWVYEFRQALELDPTSETLRKELAYLLLRMSEDGRASRQDAEREFSELNDDVSVAQLGFLYLQDNRRDLAMPLLNRVLAHGDENIANRVRLALQMPVALEERKTVRAEQDSLDPRVLGDKSYQAGFLKDARRYFLLAREANPLDSSLALKLGWTSNMLHDDVDALRWFGIARQSADADVAAQAKRAWGNLKPAQNRFRTTLWFYPLISSRRSDLFGYGQVKTELRVKALPIRPYVSLRLSGDVRRVSGGPVPQSLSESALVASAGVASNTWHRATAWFEAGIAVSYLNGSRWSDYRGGVSWARTRGAGLTSERPGWFLETTNDTVYISHFGEDLINYAQSRAGYTTVLPGARAQVSWNQSLTLDVRRQYWANYAEMGPGVRVHPSGFPTPVWINASVVRGVYLHNDGNPGRPNFFDFQVGIWYAFTK